jgi:ribosomal protein S18 acetylase RimI-like enzyme
VLCASLRREEGRGERLRNPLLFSGRSGRTRESGVGTLETGGWGEVRIKRQSEEYPVPLSRVAKNVFPNRGKIDDDFLARNPWVVHDDASTGFEQEFYMPNPQFVTQGLGGYAQGDTQGEGPQDERNWREVKFNRDEGFYHPDTGEGVGEYEWGHFRPDRTMHVSFLEEAMADTSPWHPHIRHYPPPLSSSEGEYNIVLPDPTHPEGKRPVGKMTYELMSGIARGGDPELYINSLSVNPKVQGKGAAQALLERAHMDHPNHKINPGYTTSMGSGLVEHLLQTVPDAQSKVSPRYKPKPLPEEEALDYQYGEDQYWDERNEKWDQFKEHEPVKKIIGHGRVAAVTQDLVDRLHNEFHQWWHDTGYDEIQKGQTQSERGPIQWWPNVEEFLSEKYPAAHRGYDNGLEEAGSNLRGLSPMPYQQQSGMDTTPYDTGPEAVARHGYDPKEIAAGMLLLHNKAHPFRGDLAEEDQVRLNDIFNKRQQMQRDYEQRTAMAAEDWEVRGQPLEPIDDHLSEGYYSAHSKVDGGKVGELQCSSNWPGHLYIDSIITHPDVRGEGVARAMLTQMVKDHPRHKIDPGRTTELGEAMRQHMQGKHPDISVLKGQSDRAEDFDPHYHLKWHTGSLEFQRGDIAAFDREAANTLPVSQMAQRYKDLRTTPHVTLAPEESEELKGLDDWRYELNDRWQKMDPSLTEEDDKAHQLMDFDHHLHPDCPHKIPEEMGHREKSEYYSQLQSKKSRYPRAMTSRERNHLGQMEGHVGEHLSQIQRDAQRKLDESSDYQMFGEHPDGILEMADHPQKSDPGLTHQWAAEITSNPDRYHHLLVRSAKDYQKTLGKLAEKGPFTQDWAGLGGVDPHNSTYQNHMIAHDRLRVDLQHSKLFRVNDLSGLSQSDDPTGKWQQTHDLVNPRYGEGTGEDDQYQDWMNDEDFLSTDDPKATRPDYERYNSHKDAYRVNCQRVILAAELRHRGYNVEAAPNVAPSVDDTVSRDEERLRGTDKSLGGGHDIASWFKNPDGTTARWNATDDVFPELSRAPEDGHQHWEAMHNEIKSWGAGARGIIDFQHPGRGGHVFNVSVDEDGEVNYFDHQPGKDASSYHDKPAWDHHNRENGREYRMMWSGVKPLDSYDQKRFSGPDGEEKKLEAYNDLHAPLRFLRTDDKDLDPSISQHVIDRGDAVPHRKIAGPVEGRDYSYYDD